LPGGDLPDASDTIDRAVREHRDITSPETLRHLVAAYGSRYREVLELASEPRWRCAVSDLSPVIGAELVWAVRREMAVTLGDAVTRRTSLGALGYPGDSAAARAAEIVGAELGWTDERRHEEIQALRDFYSIEA